jgi:hypothetical protein
MTTNEQGTQPNTDPEIDAQLDAEEQAGNENMRKLGMTDTEIAKARGRTVEVVAPKPKRALADVEAELGELRAMRKDNRQAYWRKETQEREAALYVELEALKAGGAVAPEQPERQDGQHADAGNADGLPESLQREWSKSGPGGVEDALRAVRERTIIAFQGLEDGGEGLRASFDRDLPVDAQTAIASKLADDSGKWPVASATEVQEFGDLPHGGVLVKEWGQNSGRMLGRAKREAANIESRLTEQSKLRLHRWIAGRSAAELSAAVRVLAARAVRRL